MRILVAILAMVGAAAGAGDLPSATSCQPGAAKCSHSKDDLKQAREAFERGVKLRRSGKNREAFESFEHAARLVPENTDYLSAQEITRQQVVFEHLQRGNASLLAKKQVEAQAEFRAASQLDPSNEFARQRMRDALGEWTPGARPAQTRVLAEAGEIQVRPQEVVADFHFTGDSRELLQQVVKTYGLTAIMDESVQPRRVKFDVTNVNFFTAMRQACLVTKTFWAPLDEKQLMIAADTQQNHRQFDRMAMRTIYIPAVTSPQQLNDVVNMLRTLFEVRFVSQQVASSTITVRAPQQVLEAATRLLENLDESRPQVLLDVQLFEVSHTFTRNMGINAPAQFSIFNIPAGALALLGGQNIQQLINQLISSGGINQADTTKLSALLAQLQNQQSNSIFSQPLATFGGGKTLTGISIPQVTATLSLNESWATTLDHVTLHAAQGDSATFRAGTRFPILNASFAPVFNTPAIANVIQNGSFTAPFPSFNYEDLGLTLKAKPAIHGSSSVTLNLELQLRALGGQSINGVPIINTREYKGMIMVKNGEPAVVAGTISNQEIKSLQGLPLVAQVPGINKITGSNQNQQDDNELLVVITPHVLSTPTSESTEVWLP